MCGVNALLYFKKSNDIFKKCFRGLELLEYRGYDSYGIFYKTDNKYIICKDKGRIGTIKDKFNEIESNIVIGHTRWATHGIPCKENSHPHISNNEKIVLVHNGIIENYSELRDFLLNKGFNFYSSTDSEVVVNYIQYINSINKYKSFNEILSLSCKNFMGSYSLIIYNKNIKDTLFLIKKSAPLIIGINDKGYEITSDILTFDKQIKSILDMPDNSIIKLHNKTIENISLDFNKTLEIKLEKFNLNTSNIAKGRYKHFMLKEIMLQGNSIKSCLRGRYINNCILLPELNNIKDLLIKKNKLTICACGTSYYAGMVGKIIIEELCEMDVIIEQASEYRYRKTLINKNDIMLVLSQSGETADTMGAMDKFHQHGGKTISICNVLGSSIYKKSHSKLSLNIGPEIGVASTKAFTGQMYVLYLIAIWLSEQKNIKNENRDKIKQSLIDLPNIYSTFIKKLMPVIKRIGKNYKFCNNMLFMGRGYNYPIALEGALKMKEISYIHAEGYSASEMKHGPIALIDNLMPIVYIILKDDVYLKLKTNLEEIKSRGGSVIGIVNENNNELDDLIDDKIKLPEIEQQLYPFISIIPIQLLSYYLALERKCNIDQPRNLAKSVTVE